MRLAAEIPRFNFIFPLKFPGESAIGTLFYVKYLNTLADFDTEKALPVPYSRQTTYPDGIAMTISSISTKVIDNDITITFKRMHGCDSSRSFEKYCKTRVGYW